MLFYNDFSASIVYLYAYMFVYNITLILLFWIISSIFISTNKTLSSFSGFNLNSSALFLLTISIFSIAGVPPFTGFLSKIFILNLLINQKLAYLYFFLFLLLFVGLYFYIQNMRFLHSSNYNSHLSIKFLSQNAVWLPYTYYAVIVAFFLIFGIFFIDDVLLVFQWILN